MLVRHTEYNFNIRHKTVTLSWDIQAQEDIVKLLFDADLAYHIILIS